MSIISNVSSNRFSIIKADTLKKEWNLKFYIFFINFYKFSVTVRPIVKYLKELKELRELRKIIHQYAYEEGVKDLKNFITNSKEVDTIIIKGSALNDIIDKLISENNK